MYYCCPLSAQGKVKQIVGSTLQDLQRCVSLLRVQTAADHSPACWLLCVPLYASFSRQPTTCCTACSGGDQALKTNFESENPSSW